MHAAPATALTAVVSSNKENSGKNSGDALNQVSP